MSEIPHIPATVVALYDHLPGWLDADWIAEPLGNLAVTLAYDHVWDGLTDADAQRVAERVGIEMIRSAFLPEFRGEAVERITARADDALADRAFDDRVAAGLALHRAARILGGQP